MTCCMMFTVRQIYLKHQRGEDETLLYFPQVQPGDKGQWPNAAEAVWAVGHPDDHPTTASSTSTHSLINFCSQLYSCWKMLGLAGLWATSWIEMGRQMFYLLHPCSRVYKSVNLFKRRRKIHMLRAGFRAGWCGQLPRVLRSVGCHTHTHTCE